MTQLVLPLGERYRLSTAFAWMLPTLDCELATRAMHGAHVRYLLAYFGDLDLRELRYAQVRAYVQAERARGLAKETIKKRLSTLKLALLEAVARGVIERLPEWPVIRSDTRPSLGYWTIADWRTAHELTDDDDLRTWIANGWWGGMHLSDLDRFRWGDVDLSAGTWIRRNTKTKAQPARLALPTEWRRVLEERRRHVAGHPRDLIAGHPMGNCNRELKELAARVGVPRISTIGLRHSCVTYLFESGCESAFVQHWTGLTSERMLQRHYRHVTTVMHDRNVEKMNARATA